MNLIIKCDFDLLTEVVNVDCSPVVSERAVAYMPKSNVNLASTFRVIALVRIWRCKHPGQEGANVTLVLSSNDDVGPEDNTKIKISLENAETGKVKLIKQKKSPLARKANHDTAWFRTEGKALLRTGEIPPHNSYRRMKQSEMNIDEYLYQRVIGTLN